MTHSEHDRRMAILAAAQPYTSGRQRHALDLVLQTNALLATARGASSPALEACETQAQPEEMLLHMQEYCTPKETDLIQMILNFMQASHLFRNYREFMAAQAATGESGELHAAGTGTPSAQPLPMLLQLLGGLGGGSGNSQQFMNFLISQLPPEQQQIFEQLQEFSGAPDGKEALV